MVFVKPLKPMHRIVPEPSSSYNHCRSSVKPAIWQFCGKQLVNANYLNLSTAVYKCKAMGTKSIQKRSIAFLSDVYLTSHCRVLANNTFHSLKLEVFQTKIYE